jgi:hypothetical protein
MGVDSPSPNQDPGRPGSFHEDPDTPEIFGRSRQGGIVTGPVKNLAFLRHVIRISIGFC